MARINNLLTGDLAEPETGLGSWIFTGATPVIEREGTPTNVGAMVALIPTSTTSTVKIQLLNYEITEQYRGDMVDFGCFIRSDGKISIEASLVSSSTQAALPESVAVPTRTKSFVPSRGAWSFPRLSRVSTGTIAVPQFVSIHISITGHNGSPIYFARPILVPTFFHLDDEPTNVLLSYLPSEIIDMDNSSDSPVAAVSKLLQVLTVAYQDTWELHNSFQNLDHIDSWNNQKEEFSSALVNPEFIDVAVYARWLGQFVGTILIDASGGLTPWANLPKVWSQWVNIDDDSPPSANDVEWTEIEGFNVELIGSVDYFKWQLQTGSYAARGGTYEAMRAAAQRVLFGTKTVDIRHHPTLDWTITVQTKEAETTPLLLLSAILASKPAGFDVIINDPFLP